jgi:hypothetical protein
LPEPAPPHPAAASGDKDKASVGEAAHAISGDASQKEGASLDHGVERDPRLHLIRKLIFGTRLRKLITGVVTLIIAPTIVLVIGALIFHWWFIPPKGESESPTQVLFYEPWNAANINKVTLNGIHVDHVTRGHCWESSIVTQRSDAYRCLTASGGAILDPCFADPFGLPSGSKEVACPYPSPDSITIMQLTQPLPKISIRPSLPTVYWLLVLANGMECHAGGGTTESIGGEVESAYYYCPGHRFPLYGYPDSSSSTWTILEQPKDAPGLEPVPIARVYH